MDNESYHDGWHWAGDKLRDYTPGVVKRDAQGAAQDSDDPDAFYEGAMDRVGGFGLLP